MEHEPQRDNRAPEPLTGVAAWLFRALLPIAERDEVLEDLAAERAQRAATQGRLSARFWLWRQLFGSLPALVRRAWWRGWTGFEPTANRLNYGGFAMETWIMDLRFSARRLVNRPVYTLLAVLTLALGVGGTAAIFSIVRALLLDPLPVEREEQVGVLWMDGSWTEQEFLHFRPDFPGFQRMAAYMHGDQTLEVDRQPLRMVRGISASAELFDVLGARPFIGRTFQKGEDVVGAAPVAVLSHGLWQELGGDPSIFGRQLRLGGESRTVVGVMPPGFWFPSPTIRVWTAARLKPDDQDGNWTLIGRIEEGRTIEGMAGPLRAFASELKQRFTYLPDWDKTRAPAIRSLRDYIVGDVRTGLFATLGAMGAILLIACVNVAALMLGQVSSRSTELAVRSALGAARRRLVQQLVCESLLLGLLAAIAGAAVATAAFRTLLRVLPLGTLADAARVDWTLFAAAIGFALLAALLVAVVPAGALWRSRLQGSLATARTSGLSSRGGRLEGGLVVAQIALAVLLVAGAGLLLRSVANLRSVDIGIRVDSVAVIDATMPVQLSSDERLRAVLDILPALEALPGVRAVAAALKLPLRGSGHNFGIGIVGKPDLEKSTTAFRTVTVNYLAAMGIKVVRGRGFIPTDRLSTSRVVVVNEALAAKYFPGEDPIGRVLQTFDDRGERIIGVVANVAEQDLTDGPVPARYMLYEHVPIFVPATSFVLAGQRPEDVPRLLDSGRQVIQREGRALAIERTLSMASIFEDAVGVPGRVAVLLSLLAGLAMALGAVGVYGVISHSVTRRKRDYGIRLALGLPPRRVASHVLGRGLRLVGLGSLIGIGAALMLTRLLATLLYGVRATDPQVLAGAVMTLVIAGIVACFIPAWRASRTNLMSVLRDE
ncbi:MAG: FtsX-like permease family protein [Acidobacteria bacterium]|nr:MAG: FtsX-like permease family protein [Acidobacteriota bacterium]